MQDHTDLGFGKIPLASGKSGINGTDEQLDERMSRSADGDKLA
jgi:hypothetical protein